MGILAWQLNARVKKLVAKNKTPTYSTHQSISSLETSTKKDSLTSLLMGNISLLLLC